MIKFQKTVLAYRWCNFHRAKLYFSSVIEAVARDLFMTLDISLSSHDQIRFDSFIAQTLLASRSTFEATSLDGSHLTLEYPRRLATALLMTYHGGSDSRLDHNTTPNVTIRPTNVRAIPEPVLTGHPQWTEEKVDLLQMLCSYVNLRSVQYELSAFHEGMRNAIVQANHDALLVLLWQADRLVAYRPSHSHSHDESPFEPPGELFRLVARRGMRDSAVLDECSSSENGVATSVSVKLFTLLLRVHAESMPRNDIDITRWAQQLLTCRDSSEPNPAGFARWVLDWGERESGSEFLYSRYAIAKSTMKRKVRRPLFRGGGVSRTRKDDEMVRRFVEICGRRVERFGEEVERIGRARGGGEVS